jgi:hypothetical protein
VSEPKLDVRALLFKSCEGKSYRPNVVDKRFPNKTVKVLSYVGVGRLGSGELAHLMRVESKNPGSIWMPPATKFLEEHSEILTEQTKKN